MIIAGLAGESGSGKTTVAAHLTTRGGGHIDLDIIGHEVLTGNKGAREEIASRISAEVIYQIVKSHIEHRAYRDKIAEPHVLLDRPVQDGGAQSAALRYESDSAGQGRLVGKARVKIYRGLNKAQAVRPDNPHAVFSGALKNGIAKRLAFLADLFELDSIVAGVTNKIEVPISAV